MTTTLPTGHITYIFTDIEGSTRLWEQEPDSMRTALARHDDIITTTVENCGGTIVRSRGEGDSLFGVFPLASDAVAAAYAIQLSLHSEPWPTSTPIRVRMALHTGESELRGNDYYGSVVNRCARLRGIAYGGQTLMSAVTAGLVADSLPEGTELRALGPHLLRDLQRPEEVYQLTHPRLPSDFPPIKPLEDQQEIALLREGDFVGRESEMGELRFALGEAMSGKARTVMLVGEPGIGKTRIAEEIAATAEQRGARVWWGRCLEERGAPPYWPWLQPIRSYVERTDAGPLETELGLGASDIAEILPELKRKLPDLDPPPSVDPEHARFRLFESVVNFLKNVCLNQPLVFVLDDLHWADRSSLSLLEFVVRDIESSKLLIIGTYRDVEITRGHPLTRTLGTLTRESHFQRIAVRGLMEQDVGRYVESASENSVDSGLVSLIFSRTEGNPLFVRELVRLMDQEGELRESGFRLPEGIRETIGGRLVELSDECNRMLTIASVIGREFDFRLLRELTDLTEDEVLNLIDEALDAHVIEDMAGSLERYGFSHSLIQETLSQELSSSRRVRLHARIGEALEKLYEGDIESRASELAYHYSQAEGVTGKDKLIEYSLMSGEQALSVFAFEEAQAHFEAGIDAKEGQPMDDVKAAILSGLGRALVAMNQHNQAAANLKLAFDYYIEVGDITRAVGVVEYPYNMFLNMLMEGTLARALELVPSGSLQSARLLCSYGIAAGARGNGYTQGLEALEASLAIAKREGNLALERRAMAASAQIDGAHMKWESSLRKSLRALELASQIDDDPIDKLRAYIWANNSSCAIGDPNSAEKYLDEMHSIAESLHDVYWIQQVSSRRRVLAYLSGDWRSIQTLDHRSVDAESNSVLAMALYQTGDIDKGKAYMNAITGPEYSDRHRIRRCLTASWLCYISGEIDILTEVEPAARAALENSALPPIEAWDARAALAYVAVLRQESSAAGEQYAALKPSSNAVTQTGAICSDRLLGLLAHIMGNVDTAQTHFEDALAFCRQAGYRPELAWTCYDYADMLVEAGISRSDSSDDANSLIDEGLSIATELGMNPLVEKLTALKERLDSTPSKPSYPKGLTEREMEVLRLAAQGKTNREIAAELFISVRTVQNHIRSIYNKIDVRNRAEATAFAINNLAPL